MDTEPADRAGGIDPLALFLVVLGAAGAAWGITMLWLGMRAVMGVGGFCASGGPYEIATPCPKGITLAMFAGIWGGLIFAGIYVWGAIRARIHSLVLLLWPALFLSLGWNFLSFGLHPPGQDGGVSGGWLFCAVLFFLMGGVPLLPALGSAIHWLRGGTDDPERDWHRHFRIPSVASMASIPSMLSTLRTVATAASAAATAAGSSRPDPTEGSGDLVSDLERLDAVKRSGALSEDEYQRAKTAVLERKEARS